MISLFTDHMNIDEVHNNGNWCDFGYISWRAKSSTPGCRPGTPVHHDHPGPERTVNT